MIDQKSNYGNLYKQAADWLNGQAEKNDNLALLSVNEFALSPLFLRSDISISPYHFSGFDQKGEYAIEVYNPASPRIFAYKYLYRFLKPVYTLTVDGVPMLKIFHNSPTKSKVDMTKMVTTTDFQTKEVIFDGSNQILIHLNQVASVVKITVENTAKFCQSTSFKYGDEEIDFFDSSGTKTSQYLFAEKRLLGANLIQYSFPGEFAQNILINPVNNDSCFMGGKIQAASFLK